jgi:hypothetical protein
MSEQQFEGGRLWHIKRSPQGIRAGHARAILKQQARAVRVFQRVVERFTVIGIGAGLQEHLRESRIAHHACRTVKGRQRLRPVGSGEGSRRKTVADTLVGIGPGLEKMLRALT